jgi:hypothetical protein
LGEVRVKGWVGVSVQGGKLALSLFESLVEKPDACDFN